MDPLLPKVSQIFEYLLAVKNLNERIIRSINQYEEVWWQSKLPNVNGCYLYGNGPNTEAWLEVHKQEIPPPPSLPQILSQWVKKWNDPDQEPTVEAVIKITANIESEGQKKEVEKEKEVLFEEDPKRLEVYHDWLRDEWRTWAAEASPKKKIQVLYMKLFSLHQRFQREGDDIELVWGHGLLSWNIQSENILRPLLITRLELQFEAKKGIFYLLPTSKGTVMETDMLNNIEVPNIQRIQEIGRQISDTEIDPRDEESIGALLKEIVHTISAEGKYYSLDSQIEEKGKSPIIGYSPVLLLRKSGGRIWQNELSTVLNKLKDGYPVPKTITLLTTDDETTLSSQKSMDPTWNSVGEELLFPLPSNFEQKLIAQKLASNPGVVVQGPPGTGKSHTIVNLISHLLAHGKRVLVTSEKERALQVLRDKIPEEIRALCVSLLGGDSKSMKDLEDSIKHIAENLDRLQPEILTKNIERKNKELHETRKTIAKLQHEINSAAELENQKIIVDQYEMTPMEIGKWLHDYITYNWLPDEIPLGIDIPLSEDELKKYFYLLGSLSSKDIEQLEMVRPKRADLPSPSQFQEKVNHITQLKNEAIERKEHVKGWTIPETYSDLDNLVSRLKMVIQELDKLQEPWCQNLFAEVLKSEKKVKEWDLFVKESGERLAKLEQLEKELIETVIDFPESINQTAAKEDLIELGVKLKGKKAIGWFFKHVLGRKYAYLFDGLKIDGLPIRSAKDIDVLLKYIEINDIKSKLSLKWNRTMEEINGVTIESKMSRYRNYVEDHLNKIQSIVFWKSGVIEDLHELIQSLGVPEPYNWIERDWYEQVLLGISSIKAINKYNDAKEFICDLEAILYSGLNFNNAHCSWKNLLDACTNMDVDFWTKSYLHVKRLEDLEDDYNAFCTYTNKLSVIAPNWVNQLVQQGRRGEEIKLPPDLREAWKWSQLNHWMINHQEKTNIEHKEQLLEIERKAEARIIKELVVDSTWLSQIQRTTKPQKTSLHAWLNAIKRIGKGTGKYANMYRKEASEEMKTCRGAIPVWIMPIQKVIENIQLNGDLFDVVIVDESSQSDLFSLTALLRAKKVVIVGDDNQISPESVGQDIGEVKHLIDRYLTGIPHRNRFEMKTSLYDMASQVFDSNIILKEHFRCVPEIIQFSNDLMYGGQMDPLRLPLGHEKMEPPIKTIHVAEGYRSENTTKALNIPEAEALVQYVADCCKDPKYDGKTFGVISLQGYDQAKLIEELLREVIGEEEMINRRLVCGDSYSFQGDERDVIFLSMVAANNVRFAALAKRSDLQRFNVAASRARDQMVLFHSVELRDLNNTCVRYSLLQYCKDPKRVQLQLGQVEHEFDSQFEKDVFTLIAARGYRVIPQVKVGTVGKKIDLVIEGIRGRLAVECDGDKWHGLDQWEADMERQLILERVGWTFWRVRGSAFYRDPVKSMEPLWSKLNELQIMPGKFVDNNQQLYAGQKD